MSESTNAGAVRLTPVAVEERVELLDILRGFALLGILVVNFWGSSSEGARKLDQVVSTILNILVDSSFYPLFSFLFGLGFAVQLMRARERGAGVVALYVRRMLALFLIGAFHAIVIWNGDILVDYAVLGLLLVPLHRLPDRWLLALAAIPLILGLWGPAVRGVLDQIGGERAAEAAALQQVVTGEENQATRALVNRYELDSTATRAASFSSSIASRWRVFQRTLRQLLSRYSLLNDIPAFFLIGFVVGRRRILQEAERHRKGLMLAAVIGMIGAILGALIEYVVDPESRALQGLAWSVNSYGMTLFYISAIALGVTFWPAFARAFRAFAPAGRVGLSNYLLQSITMTVLFSHYGASLTAPTTAIWLVLNVIFFFGVQLPLSRWWIRRYRFGPAEWVWRSLTYGAAQPMHLAETAGGGMHAQPAASLP